MQQKCASDDDLSLGMREPVDAGPLFRFWDMERLVRRLAAAERRAHAVAAQRDALREQLALAQRRCGDLLSENAQVYGMNEALSGMLAILRAAEPDPPADNAALHHSSSDGGHHAAQGGEEGSESGDTMSAAALHAMLSEIYGPQYAMLRTEEIARDDGGEIVE